MHVRGDTVSNALGFSLPRSTQAGHGFLVLEIDGGMAGSVGLRRDDIAKFSIPTRSLSCYKAGAAFRYFDPQSNKDV